MGTKLAKYCNGSIPETSLSVTELMFSDSFLEALSLYLLFTATIITESSLRASQAGFFSI